MKKNRALWLDNVYNDRGCSDILVKTQKLFSYVAQPPFSDHLVLCPISNINRDSTLVSYYEEGDLYESHHDDTMFTAVTWFVREPRKFEGGDLVITGYNKLKHTVELKHNRCVVFRGYTHHQVLPVTNYTAEPFSGYGRYTLSQFMTLS